MRNAKRWLLPLMIFPFIVSAKAADSGKIEGILHGYVTDAVTKKPLQGVTVSAMIPGTDIFKEVTTDADGYFHFVQLPATQVTVQFEKKGYQSCKKPNVFLKEKTSTKLNVEFMPEAVNVGDSDNSEYPVLRLMQTS